MTTTSNGKVLGVLVGGAVLGAVLGAGITMQLKKGGGSPLSASSGATCGVEGAASANPTLFELDGKAYTAEQLPTEARDTLFQIQSQGFETSANFARELALRMALASDQKMDTAQGLPPLRIVAGQEDERRIDGPQHVRPVSAGLPPPLGPFGPDHQGPGSHRFRTASGP